jgi:hypothetical protein
MNRIEEVEFLGTAERNDVRCADVEVKVSGMDEPLIVEFTASRDNDFDMTHIYKKDADRTLDWYDNNLHRAFKDVTVELFEDLAGETHWGPREAFKQEVLSYGNIRKELEAHLSVQDGAPAAAFLAADGEERHCSP